MESISLPVKHSKAFGLCKVQDHALKQEPTSTSNVIRDSVFHVNSSAASTQTSSLWLWPPLTNIRVYVPSNRASDRFDHNTWLLYI